MDDKFYDGFSAFVCSQANAEMSGRKRADFYGWHRGEHDDLPDRLTPAIRAFTVFCRRDFDSACDVIRVGFGKQPVRMYRKAFVFLYISAFLMSGILQLFRPYMDTMSLFFVIASAAYAVLKGIQSLWENIQGEQKRITARYF